MNEIQLKEARMIAEREALEAAIVCLRDPLSRIQLAATQGDDPELPTDPTMLSIQHAVAEIDMRLEDTLTNLRRVLREATPDSDIRAGLVHIVDDLKPSLEARGIEFIVEPLPDTPVYGDALLLRRLICRMFLGMGRWLGSQQGTVSFELGHPNGELTLKLEATAADPDLVPARRSILGPLASFALAEGIEITLHEDPASGRAEIVARFPRSHAT
jgi:hypothetical protein